MAVGGGTHLFELGERAAVCTYLGTGGAARTNGRSLMDFAAWRGAMSTSWAMPAQTPTRR